MLSNYQKSKDKKTNIENRYQKAVNENNNTKDSQEGMMAFLEKRKPQFNK